MAFKRGNSLLPDTSASVARHFIQTKGRWVCKGPNSHPPKLESIVGVFEGHTCHILPYRRQHVVNVEESWCGEKYTLQTPSSQILI